MDAILSTHVLPSPIRERFSTAEIIVKNHKNGVMLMPLGHTPRQETLDFIERVENGEEEIEGPFTSKEALWESLGTHSDVLE